MPDKLHQGPDNDERCNTRLLNSIAGLAEFLTQHANANEAVMLDTEFVRVSTYYPEFCLLQLRTGAHIALVDVIAISELDALWAWLQQHEHVVMHSASQDLEVLRLAGCPRLDNLFDTQIAAQLVGHAQQIGYAAIVEQVVGVQVDKGLSRFDWRTRPLPSNAQRYAADDVRYLPEVLAYLQAELATVGRADWAKEEFQHQLDADANQLPDAQQWRRVKGAAKLNPAAQARAKALATWREQTAREHNQPRGWVLTDRDLCSAAEQHDVKQLSSCVGKRFRKHLPADILQCAELPEAELLLDLNPLNAKERKAFAAIKEQIGMAAAELDIEPSVIANRKMLEQWARGAKPAKLSQGWRAGLVNITAT